MSTSWSALSPKDQCFQVSSRIDTDFKEYLWPHLSQSRLLCYLLDFLYSRTCHLQKQTVQLCSKAKIQPNLRLAMQTICMTGKKLPFWRWSKKVTKTTRRRSLRVIPAGTLYGRTPGVIQIWRSIRNTCLLGIA